MVFETSSILGVEYLINYQFGVFGEAHTGFATGSMIGTSSGAEVSVPSNATTVSLRVGANSYF